MGLVGASRRRRIATTRRNAEYRPTSDLVRGNLFAWKPNELGAADIIVVHIFASLRFLVVAMNVPSRLIVGWAFSADLKTPVVLDAAMKELSH